MQLRRRRNLGANQLAPAIEQPRLCRPQHDRGRVRGIFSAAGGGTVKSRRASSVMPPQGTKSISLGTKFISIVLQPGRDPPPDSSDETHKFPICGPSRNDLVSGANTVANKLFGARRRDKLSFVLLP